MKRIGLVVSCVVPVLVLVLGPAGCKKKPTDGGAGQSQAAGMDTPASMDVMRAMGGPGAGAMGGPGAGAMGARPATRDAVPICEKKGLVRLGLYLGHM